MKQSNPILLAILVVISSFFVLEAFKGDRPGKPLSEFDQPFYISIAYDLNKHGVFSDGVFDQVDSTRDTPPSGMFIAPVYPALLAVAMRFDPAFYAAAECMLTAKAAGQEIASGCPVDDSIMRRVHRAFWAGSVGCLFLIATGMFAWRPAAVAVAMVALAAAMINRDASTYLMTESTTVLLVTGHVAALYWALKRRRVGLMLLAGLVLGLLTLTRPSYLYLFWTYTALAAATGLLAGARMRRSWAGLVAAFAVGFIAVVLPWLMRNFVECGHFALTWGYGASVLIERMAYNGMSLGEWAVSFLYWLPDFGDNATAALFPQTLFERLDWNRPGSFYDMGVARRWAMVASGADMDRLLPSILRDEILPDLPWHLMVTLSLFWRGLWVYKYLSLVLMPVLAAFTARAAARRDWCVLVVILPPFLMNGLHGLLAVNQPRYNLSLVIGLALAAGWAVSSLQERVERRSVRSPLIKFH